MADLILNVNNGANDTLVVSHLGYKTFKRRLSDCIESNDDYLRRLLHSTKDSNNNVT